MSSKYLKFEAKNPLRRGPIRMKELQYAVKCTACPKKDLYPNGNVQSHCREENTLMPSLLGKKTDLFAAIIRTARRRVASSKRKKKDNNPLRALQRKQILLRINGNKPIQLLALVLAHCGIGRSASRLCLVTLCNLQINPGIRLNPAIRAAFLSPTVRTPLAGQIIALGVGRGSRRRGVAFCLVLA